MTEWRILNTLDLTGAPEAVAAIEQVGELVSMPPERDHILENIADFDVYFASADVRVDPQFLDAATRLKLIGSPSTGTDHLDRVAVAAIELERHHATSHWQGGHDGPHEDRRGAKWAVGWELGHE